MKALLLVDIQRDFLPGGALAVANGHDVIEVANRLMPQYDVVVATQDWHPANHKSFASQHTGKRVGEMHEIEGLPQIMWPDHCIEHTHGAKLAARLNRAGVHHVIRKGTDPSVDSYSAFFDNARRKATGLTQFLREHDVDEVHIMGLATDYCVKATALDAVEQGLRTVLLTEGIRGVDLQSGDCARAIEEMRAAGVEIR